MAGVHSEMWSWGILGRLQCWLSRGWEQAFMALSQELCPFLFVKEHRLRWETEQAEDTFHLRSQALECSVPPHTLPNRCFPILLLLAFREVSIGCQNATLIRSEDRELKYKTRSWVALMKLCWRIICEAAFVCTRQQTKQFDFVTGNDSIESVFQCH